MWNREAFHQLMAAYRDDIEVLDMISDAIHAFSQYYAAVLEDQSFPRIYSGALSGEEYRSRRAELDRQRTAIHNAMITHVRILNRMAERAGLPLIYDGVVSEDRPFRTQLADTVFSYVSWVIEHRE